MPRQHKLRKKKVGNSAYWFTKAGGETYFGNVDQIPFKQARKLFSDHVGNLLESERASKEKVLTADELMDLFLVGSCAFASDHATGSSTAQDSPVEVCRNQPSSRLSPPLAYHRALRSVGGLRRGNSLSPSR